MSKLELQDITTELEGLPSKPWYKSKTMWLNIITAGAVFTEGLSAVLSGMGPLMGPALPWVVFGVTLLNLVLRSVTDVAIK